MVYKFRTPEGKALAQKRRKRKIIFLLLFIFLFVGGFFFLMTRDVFLVKKSVIEFKNNSSLLDSPEIEEEIQKTLEGKNIFFIPKNNIFFLSKKSIEKDLYRNFPRIKKVKIEKMGFTTLHILLEERKRNALWCGDIVPPDPSFFLEDKIGVCYEVDEGGFIFSLFERKENESLENILRFYSSIESASPIGNILVEVSLFSDLLLLSSALSSAGYPLYALLIVDERDIEFMLKKEGVWVRALLKENSQKIIEKLISTLSSDVLKGEIEYIDIRFGNTVYVKKKEENEEEKRGNDSLEEENE
jgi:cell division septal protein FtsQ